MALNKLPEDITKHIANLEKRMSMMERMIRGQVSSADGRTYLDLENSLIKMNDGSNDRVLIDGANGVMKISQSGHDVDIAADDKLVLSSEFNMFKISQTGSVSHVHPSGSYFHTSQVAHGLGYAPMVMGWDYNSTNGLYQMCPVLEFEGSVLLHESICRADATNIEFLTYYVDAPTTNITFDFRYYILAETTNV